MRILCLSLIFSFLFSFMAFAEEQTDIWWKKSPLSYEKVPQDLKFHIEGQFKYDRIDGNFEGQVIEGEGELVVRKGRFTNHTYYGIDKQDIEVSATGQELDYDKQEFRDFLRYDLTKYVFLGPGYQYTIDDKRLIDNRKTMFFGVGLNLVQTPKHILRVFGAYGKEELEYTVPLDDEDSDGAYFLQEYYWVINPTIRLNQNFEYIKNLDIDENYRWHADISLNFQLAPHFFFVFTSEYDYDNNSLLNMDKEDYKQSFGVKFSY